jgi:MHS family proline/betaine transporter-like MFS transporter
MQASAVSEVGLVPATGGARRAVTAAVLGNVLEWYDFAVYGFLAGIIGKVFFPSGDEVTQLLSAFAVFGVGFVVRPLGGILIGRLGDLKGRKAALILTIMLMAIGTVLIGVVPSYGAIGVLAPAIIVVARLLQGFSAGGEWGGSTSFIVEWAPENRRGLYGSFQQCSVVAGLLLGSGISALFSTLLAPGEMEAWGWRIPFLLGGIIGPVGIYMRRNVEETPAYRRAQRQVALVADDAAPLLLAARAFGFTILWTVCFYICLTYLPTWTTKYAGITRPEALWSNTLGLFVLVIAIPLMGHVSDLVGRKRLILAACAALIVLPYPFFAFMLDKPGLAAIMVVQVVFGLVISMYSGAGPAAISEIFPTHRRSTWMTSGYALSVAVFGGFAPYIATWLIDRTGNAISPTWYLIAAAIVSTIVIAQLRETAHEALR